MTRYHDDGGKDFRRSKFIASYSMIVAIVAVTLAITLRATDADTSSASHTEAILAEESRYTNAQPAHLPSVSSLIGGLEARLEENPNDGRGWLLLAKSYEHLGRYDDAREAFAHAAALGATDEARQESSSTLTPQAAMDLWAGS